MPSGHHNKHVVDADCCKWSISISPLDLHILTDDKERNRGDNVAISHAAPEKKTDATSGTLDGCDNAGQCQPRLQFGRVLTV